MSDSFSPLATKTEAGIAWSHSATLDNLLNYLEKFEHRIRDAEARAAADRVESLPYRNDGRTVNRNNAIMAARRGLPR
jgi:hypothetical protein